MTEMLPDPPVPLDCDLRKYRKMPVDIVRLKNSDIHVECTMEEKWVAFELWMASFHQVPASSLPDDDAKLAYLAGLGRDKRTWNRVKKAALRGFVKHSDGRLYHPVMSELCFEVWQTMKARSRGAKIVNEGRQTRQPTENKGNQKRSAQRSIYNERDGQRAVTDTLGHRSAGATEGVGISTPIPPSSSQAGSVGVANAPTARPSDRPQASKPERSNEHGVELADGRVCVHYPTFTPDQKPDYLLWIDRSGIVDEVSLVKDADPLSFTKDEAVTLRENARAQRAQKPHEQGAQCQ